MKKLLSVALVVLMMLCMTIPAFADEVSGNQTGDVIVNVETVGNVYYIVIDWESTVFTYAKSTWIAEEHSYSDGSYVSGDSASITITNHSNAPVTVGTSFSDGETKASNKGVDATLTGDLTKLLNPPAEGSDFADAESAVITVTVSGEPDFGTTQIKVATINITITK